MPVASSLSELREALRTRETNITRALDDLFGSRANREALQQRTEYESFRDDANILSSLQPGNKLPVWARSVLTGNLVRRALNSKELDHLDHWPPQQRENLRQKLVYALEHDEPLKFYWELHGGDDEDTDSSRPGEVVFRSPQRNLRVTGITLGVGVSVHVGP
jgi:hypothetical protein